jgi:hypothetical protein
MDKEQALRQRARGGHQHHKTLTSHDGNGTPRSIHCTICTENANGLQHKSGGNATFGLSEFNVHPFSDIIPLVLDSPPLRLLTTLERDCRFTGENKLAAKE